MLGDWREEVLIETTDRTALRLFTTNIPTDVRLYTLAHNPAYRLGFTVRGYLQSPLVDYYLGYDMAQPPRPEPSSSGTPISVTALVLSFIRISSCARRDLRQCVRLQKDG